MNRLRVEVLYGGRVQGVGFRYAVKRETAGFEVTGLIRNLPTGQVQLVVEGERDELEAFLQAIRDCGVGPFIRSEEIHWLASTGTLRGFEIVA
jgi:acylphosphatase